MRIRREASNESDVAWQRCTRSLTSRTRIQKQQRSKINSAFPHRGTAVNAVVAGYQSRIFSFSRVRCISLLGPVISYDITTRPPFPPLRSGGTSLPHPRWFSFGLHLPLSLVIVRTDADGVHVDFYLTVCPEQERDFLDGSWRFYRHAARTSSLCVYPSA